MENINESIIDALFIYTFKISSIILLMSNISDKIKANDKVNHFIKSHPTKVCNTCKREKDSKLFVRQPRSMGYSVKYLISICPECNNYDNLMSNRNFNNFKHLLDEWTDDTKRLLNCCEFIIKYENENKTKTQPAILNLKELLNTTLEKLKGKNQ